jgi:hypothetical protein
MTRYTFHKKRESGNKTKTTFAVLIIAVLVFTILAGLVKSISLPNAAFEPKLKWDSKSSFAIALDTTPPSVFVYQREPKRIIFLTLDPKMYFITGNPKTPIAQIGGALSGKNGFEIAKVMSLLFGAPITNYISFNKQENLDNKTAQKMFKDFASLATPFVIMTRGKPGFVKSTNVTRYDAFRLWWQIKGFSVESANVSDLSPLSEEVVAGNGQKVLGADTTSLNRKIHDFLENINIEKEGQNISILNQSGNQYAATVAADFIQAVGGNVVGEREGDETSENSQVITAKRSVYTPSYLAKMFGCDITEAQNNGSDGDNGITVVLGRDFANKYFK